MWVGLNYHLETAVTCNVEEDGSETGWFLLATQTTVLFGIGNPLFHMPM